MTADAAEIAKLRASPDAGLAHMHMRMDLRRNTRLFVTRNVSDHIHVTVGNSQATLIIHPHAAERLIADMQAVLAGKDFAHD